jgi:hypothetical protein
MAGGSTYGPLDPDAVTAYSELAQFEHFGPTEGDLIGTRNVYPYCGATDGLAGPGNAWSTAAGMIGWPFDGPGEHFGHCTMPVLFRDGRGSG